MRLKGKVALVTGGNGGIGAGIVKKLLEEGAKVAFCGRNEVKNEASLKIFQQISHDVLAIKCDVTDSAQVKKMFAEVLEVFGTLDILVNNAGMPRPVPSDREKYVELTTKPGPKFSLEITKSMTDEEWDESIKSNLYSVFYCCREALKIMEPKKYGKIINIASIAGVSNRSPHSPNYSAAKGGVVAFTRSLSVEVAGAGVIVNAVAPGLVGTEFIGSFGGGNEEMASRLVQPIPLNRLSTIEEQANVVAFLASDESSYIVGQVINTNGGMF